MPPVSERQRKAMWAAAKGESTLGIPKSVGAEFAAADEGGKLPARVKTRRNYAKGGTVERESWYPQEKAQADYIKSLEEE